MTGTATFGLPIKAYRRRPLGFADRSEIDFVTIVGFFFGEHPDGRGYDRPSCCAQAVCVLEDGRIEASPLYWFDVPLTAAAQGRA